MTRESRIRFPGGALRAGTVVAAVTLAATTARGAVASIDPTEPRWGETITLRYDPAADGAALRRNEAVAAYLWLWNPDGIDERYVPMTLVQGRFEATLIVPDGTGHIDAYFLSPGSWDSDEQTGCRVRTREGELARGARQWGWGNDDYEQLVQLELEAYPSNAWVWRQKWQRDAARWQGEERRLRVEPELTKLGETADTGQADVLYALCFGNLTLDREVEARRWLTKLAGEHGESQFFSRAVSDYEYAVFSRSWKGEGPEAVDKLVLGVATRHPRSPIARAKLLGFAYDTGIGIDTILPIANAWIEETPDDPKPYLATAEGLRRRGLKDEKAEQSVAKALDLLLSGGLRRYGDISGCETSMLLNLAYRVSADVAMERGKYGLALASIRTAWSLEKDERDAGTPMLEGDLWSRIGNVREAEAAYYRAWKLGSPDARKALEAVHVARGDASLSFEDYLDRLASAAARHGEVRVVPDLVAKGMDGKEIRLASLRGKVVVLNFWAIGCAPCVVEMPGLNSLVGKYRGKDVVFLAPTPDNRKDLKRFLSRKPFEYVVIPEGDALIRSFGVSAYPTHVIVDAEGSIAATFTGGSATPDERLDLVIERLLVSR